MRLAIPIPESWKRHLVPEGTLCVAPEGDLAVVITPLHAASSEPAAWLRRALSLAGPAECRPAETAEGWPVTLLEAPGEVAAYVHVLDYAAGVVARCTNDNARPRWKEEVMHLVERARPDFTNEQAVCLAQQLGAAS